MLRREARSGLRVLVDRLLDEAGLRPNTAMELGTTEALIAAVRAGVGLAWVPRITLARNAELGELGFVEVPAIAMRRTLSVVMLRVARLSRVAELVRQMLPPWRALSRAGVAVEDTLDLGTGTGAIDKLALPDRSKCN